jgi:DNA replication licensing factor MCM3
MSDVDRVAIHEVMEQQTVTIAKAGIHTTLNARCSVIAAANPIYGNYDNDLTIPRNINLPDSLLSRFDLLFVLIDKAVEKRDNEIAGHVLKMHGLANGHARQGGQALDVRDQLAEAEMGRLGEDQGEELSEESKFFLTKTRLAVAATAKGKKGGKKGAEAAEDLKVFKPSFIRKYVAFVRKRVTPTHITEEAQNMIKEFYTELRTTHRDEAGLPITARTLETIIRLATAHAKIRLDYKNVEARDVQVAIDILKFALFSDAKRERAAADESEDEGDDEEGGNDDEQPRSERKRKTPAGVSTWEGGGTGVSDLLTLTVASPALSFGVH